MEACSGQNYLINFLPCIFNLMYVVFNSTVEGINFMTWISNFLVRPINFMLHAFNYMACGINFMLDIFNFVTHLINFVICVFSFMACAESSSSHVYFIIMYTLCFKLQSVHSVQHDLCISFAVCVHLIVLYR